MPIIKYIEKTIPVIVDTDLGPWMDDFAAMKVLSELVKEKRYQVIAIMADNVYPGIVSVIDAVSTFYKLSDHPMKIGITKDSNAANYTGKYDIPSNILKSFPHPNFCDNSQAIDSVKLYRKLLSESEDSSVDILSIGYLTNLGNLLNSTSDEFSSLSGECLVQQKVRKTFLMAGIFPEGKEVNIAGDLKASLKFFSSWPTEIAIVGFDLGKQVRCGSGFIDPETNHIDDKSPLELAFKLSYEGLGRIDSCSDPIAAYLMYDYENNPIFGYEYGQMMVENDGTNRWIKKNDEQTSQKRIFLKSSSKTLVDIIDEILLK